MTNKENPIAIVATDVAIRAKTTFYPEPFASRVQGREKRQLGEFFGLSNFGVNLTRLAPSAASSVFHAHAKQDEFIYIISGRPTLITGQGEMELSSGMCAGFKAGSGSGHCLENRTQEDVLYLEMGDRTPGDSIVYPNNDLQGNLIDGKWVFRHKDGTAY